MEANLDRLAWPKRYHTSAASSIIHRRVTIRSKPSSLMANYSKIKRVEPPWSHLTMAVKGNWNTEEWENIEEVKRRTGKLRREVVGRCKGTAWDHLDNLVGFASSSVPMDLRVRCKGIFLGLCLVMWVGSHLRAVVSPIAFPFSPSSLMIDILCIPVVVRGPLTHDSRARCLPT